jgi:hypothetical protein
MRTKTIGRNFRFPNTLLLVAVLVSGCGGDGSNLPVLLAWITTPGSNATNVSIETAVSARYYKDLDPVTAGITLAGPGGDEPGSVDIVGKRVTFTPDEPLEPSTRYLASVSSGAPGTASSYSWSFETCPWHRRLGSSGLTFPRGVAVDHQGNVVVAGTTDGEFDGQSNQGGSDYFVTKYDRKGIKQWSRIVGTAGFDSLSGAAIDSGGNIIVAGTTSGSFDTYTNAGITDVFVAKHGANGELLWTRQLGTDSRDAAWGIAVDADDNIYVGGNTGGDFDGHVNTGEDDLFLVKYGPDGTKIWSRLFGTGTEALARGLAADPAGNLYFVGVTATATVQRDAFLFKLAGDGSELWYRQHGTATHESDVKVASDAAGNAYISGVFDTHNSFVLKYDPDGDLQWSRQLPALVWVQRLADVAADADGNVYAAGRVNNNFEPFMTESLVVKYDTHGTLQWWRTQRNNESGTAITALADGTSFVAGYTSKRDSTGCNAGPREDMFVVRYTADGTHF